MKILELCLSPDLGGLELYALDASRALNDTDQVVALLNPQGRLCERFEQKALHWKPFKPGARSLPLLTAKTLAAYLDNADIDAVHVHWGKDLPLAALAKWFSKRKPALIYTRHMDITKAKRDPYHRFIYHNVDRLIVTTRRMEQGVAGFLPRWFAQRISTLYMGVAAPSTLLSPSEIVAARREHGLHETDFLVGIIGRMKHAKGQHLVVEAIRQARNQGHAVSGLLVGTPFDEAYVETLRQTIAEHHLQDAIKILPFVEDPQRLMQICDAVVLASYRETFGLVLIEAMRAGVAVIGSNNGGVTEIIKPEDTGLLFDAGSADSLAQCIIQLAEHPPLRDRLAAAGKAMADERFNDEAHFKRLRELIEAAVH